VRTGKPRCSPYHVHRVGHALSALSSSASAPSVSARKQFPLGNVEPPGQELGEVPPKVLPAPDLAARMDLPPAHPAAERSRQHTDREGLAPADPLAQRVRLAPTRADLDVAEQGSNSGRSRDGRQISDLPYCAAAV
jgi:hypothetical protein